MPLQRRLLLDPKHGASHHALVAELSSTKHSLTNTFLLLTSFSGVHKLKLLVTTGWIDLCSIDP